MTLPDRIEHALVESAEAFAAPPSELEAIIVRGRRRRLASRLLAGVGSGTALVLALLVTVSFTRTAVEPEPLVGEQTEESLIENTPTATEISVVGHLADDEYGYLLVPQADAERQRLIEAHSQQVEGQALFGPAIGDGADGFIYTVSDVVAGSETRQGWVLWVPAAAAQPVVLAEEPEAGVGQVLGVIEDESRYVVYTTVIGRTTQLRRAELNTGTSFTTAPVTLVEDFASGDAAGNRIVMLGSSEGCSTLTLLDAAGAPVPFRGVPDHPCPTFEQATLSPDARSLAYLDRTDDTNLLVVLDLASGRVERSISLDSRKRIVSFDGREVTLTGETAINVATGQERQNAAVTEEYLLRLNSRLVLQVPGVGDAVAFDEVQAADAEPRPDARTSDDVDLLLEYLAEGWMISVRPDESAASAPVDLDAYGVTLRGLGPYVVGNEIQLVADESGHDLLTQESSGTCTSMRVSPLHGVTADDVVLLVEGDRLAGVEFTTDRFAFDGVTVGTPLDQAGRRLSDAEVVELGGATVLVLDIDGTSTAEFRASGDTIVSFRIAAADVCAG